MRSHVLLPMREPPIRRLVTGGAISSYGDALQNAAQAWLVVQLTHSARAVGLFAMVWLLPRVVASVVAGVFVDRNRRSDVIRVAVLAGTFVAVAFLVIDLAGALTYRRILMLAFCFSVIAPFEITARNTVLPTLSTRDKIPAVVGLNFFVMYSAELFGYLTSGVVLATAGVVGCIALNVVSYVAYLVLIAPLRSPSMPKPLESFAATLSEGVRYVFQKRHAALPLAVGAVFALTGFHFDRSTLPLFAVDDLHASARVYGLLLAASPAGAVVLLGVARARRAEALPARMVVTAMMLGVGLALLALTRSPFVALLILIGTGAARGLHYNAIATLLQLRVPDEMRGRVFSFYNFNSGIFGLGGMFMAGLAPVVGVAIDAHSAALRQLLDPNGLRGMLLVSSAAVIVCAVAFIRPLARLGHSAGLHPDESSAFPKEMTTEFPSIPRL